MAKNKNVEMVGTEFDLKKGPDDMRRDSFSGGMVEMIGSEAALGYRTVPMGVFDKGISGGSVAMDFAGKVGLDRTPRQGWESYDTPISDNSMTPQKAVSGYPRS